MWPSSHSKLSPSELKSERNITTSSLISDPLERLVLNNETPPGEHCTPKRHDRKGHHDDEGLQASRGLAVVEEVRRDDVSHVAAHVDLCSVSTVDDRELEDTPTIAPAAALFSGVVFSVDTAQVYTRGLAEKEPGVYKNAAKYLAGLFKVATVITNPTMETHSAGMMCSDRDLILSEFHAQAQETRAAKM